MLRFFILPLAFSYVFIGQLCTADETISQEVLAEPENLSQSSSEDAYEVANPPRPSEEDVYEAANPSESYEKLPREYSLEVRAAYFYPTNHRFREIYSGGGIYGLEFNAQAWKRFFVWGEVDYFSEGGKTDVDFDSTINASVPCCLKTCSSDHTHITIVPISTGLKYYFNKKPVQFYLGAGVLAAYLHTEVDSNSLVGGRGKWGFGGAFKSGLLCHIGKSFLIDFFADYYLVEVHLHRPRHKKVIIHSADISGFSFGGALGYLF